MHKLLEFCKEYKIYVSTYFNYQTDTVSLTFSKYINDKKLNVSTFVSREQLSDTNMDFEKALIIWLSSNFNIREDKED